jgi:1-acyl-sn-glycerol-3-phosphate acyltransferase
VGRGEVDGWWRLAELTVGNLCRLLLRLRYLGLERIPTEGPAILAANHVSVLDPFVICLGVVGRGRVVRFLAASEFFAHPVWRWGLRLTGQIPVHRGTLDLAAMEEAQRVLRAGGLGGIFPEGRVGDGRLPLRGRSGVTRLAMATGCPVIPVGVWGTQRRWPRGRIRLGPPLRVSVGVVVAPPIHLPPLPDTGPGLRAETARIMAALEAAVLRARALAGPDPSRR